MPAHVTQLPRVSPTQGPEPPPSPTRSSTLRPWLAATLSLVCGLGQLYNGQVPKGLILIILGMVALFSLQHPLGIIMVPLLWLYAIVDAYVVARRRG